MKRMILLIGITAAALGVSDPQPARAYESYKPAPHAAKHVIKHVTRQGAIHKPHYRRPHHRRFQRWGYRHPRYHRPRYYRPRHRGYAPGGYWYGGYYYPPFRGTFSLWYNGYRHRY